MDERRLPAHVEPMLARLGQPFDDDGWLFEIKWDGVRAVAYVEAGALRLHGRRRRDLAGRYPELDALRALPAGTIVDGELVVLREDGRPDFRAMIGRENAPAARAAAAARTTPVHYVVFDLLWLGFTSLLDRPLAERRQALATLVAAAGQPRLRLSEGVVGQGRALFAAACERGLEGVVGKRLASPYRPGERSDAWQKIKPQQVAHCLVLGYEPDGERGFKSLIVGTDLDGTLRCVGRVGSGIDAATRARLRAWLFAHPAERPLVPVPQGGAWVQPGLFCRVGFLERTDSGALRAPVFLGIVEAGAQ
ncbi:MAG: DNA ligase [Planctomycetes bacterium]|nr:DNA ligase [Planctomycetota bacterium]